MFEKFRGSNKSLESLNILILKGKSKGIPQRSVHIEIQFKEKEVKKNSKTIKDIQF